MTDRELLQMALDALNVWELMQPQTTACAVRIPAIEALRARLAQPEPLAQFKFQEYGPPNWGDSQVTKPEFVAEQKAMNEALRTMVEPVIQARKEGDLIVVDLPQVPRGSGGISKEEL